MVTSKMKSPCHCRKAQSLLIISMWSLYWVWQKHRWPQACPSVLALSGPHEKTRRPHPHGCLLISLCLHIKEQHQPGSLLWHLNSYPIKTWKAWKKTWDFLYWATKKSNFFKLFIEVKHTENDTYHTWTAQWIFLNWTHQIKTQNIISTPEAPLRAPL